MDSPNNINTNMSVGEGNKILFGILAYLGPLVIVSLLVKKDDSFVKFHIKQGLVLLSISIILWILSSIMWSFWPISKIIHIALFILSIIGIINVVQKKEKELPLVGDLARYFSL